MFRYIALIWNPASQQRADYAQLLTARLKALVPQWHEAYDHAGMRVFCADAKPDGFDAHGLANDGGVVLGFLFERNADLHDDTPARRASLDADSSRSIVRSRGEALIARYWGDYVAFLAAEDGPCKSIVKDPTGNLPCFGTSVRGVHLFFSCIADCMELQLPAFTLNRNYLHSRLLDGGMNYRHNALENVHPVHRGERVDIDAAREPALVSRRFLWTPMHFPESEHLIEDPDTAARAMRAQVRSATHSLASRHKHLLLRLSGGLDSSIVNGCLADAPARPKVVCYTYFNPRSRSDERPWARLAAAHSGFEHLEHAMVPEDLPLAAALHMPPLVEPATVLEFLQRTALEDQLSRAHLATAVFNGDGGDSGFCSDSIKFALSDYFRLHGIDAFALRLASQIALLTQLSSWTVFMRSLSQWRKGWVPAHEQEDLLSICKLVNPAVVTSFMPDRLEHPWFMTEEPIPGGIERRIGMLAANPHFYTASPDARQPAPEIVSPLYSQPVMQTLLRIPIHVHFEAGHDRGLARRAFAQEVPSAILQRRWKDRAPGFHDELVYRNRDFLKEFFLDGVLVAEGLLDKGAVEHALSSSPNKSQVLSGEIISHMGIEIWARHWLSREIRRAVA